jgi:hypothetical protein
VTQKPRYRRVELPAADVRESMRHTMAQPPMPEAERKALRDLIADLKARAA